MARTEVGFLVAGLLLGYSAIVIGLFALDRFGIYLRVSNPWLRHAIQAGFIKPWMPVFHGLGFWHDRHRHCCEPAPRIRTQQEWEEIFDALAVKDDDDGAH